MEEEDRGSSPSGLSYTVKAVFQFEDIENVETEINNDFSDQGKGFNITFNEEIVTKVSIPRKYQAGYTEKEDDLSCGHEYAPINNSGYREAKKLNKMFRKIN